MTRPNRLLLLMTLILVQAASAAALTRAARRVGVFEIHGSWAIPQGDYDGVPGTDFLFDTELIAFDAERVYRDGQAFGFSYGQIFDKHWLASLGFDFATNELRRPIEQDIGLYRYSVEFLRDTKYSSYDLMVRLLYAVNNPVRHAWSPYFGVAGVLGLTRISAPDTQADGEFAFGLNLDFGLDIKVWAQPDSRQFVTLSSMNSWSVYATKERVSHLQIGAGIKYFFGP